jgi:hypothetical protein
MNASARLFLNLHQSAAVASLAGAALLLGGCVGNPFADAQIDPGSPIAAEAARTARMNTDFPSFSEIPAQPNDVRPLRLFGAAAREVELARAKLERETAPETWTLNNTEAFAKTAQTAAGPEGGAQSRTDTDAFADILRKRATPPPPPKR